MNIKNLACCPLVGYYHIAGPNSLAMDQHLVETHLGKLGGNISQNYLAATQRMHQWSQAKAG
jgi:hypothetical protein